MTHPRMTVKWNSKRKPTEEEEEEKIPRRKEELKRNERRMGKGIKRRTRTRRKSPIARQSSRNFLLRA